MGRQENKSYSKITSQNFQEKPSAKMIYFKYIWLRKIHANVTITWRKITSWLHQKKRFQDAKGKFSSKSSKDTIGTTGNGFQLTFLESIFLAVL